jgi:cytidylate kinase
VPKTGERKLIIAIDGPAGSGKSTIASRLARKLGYSNIESGAMYRMLALAAIENDVGFEEEDRLLQLARDLRFELQPTVDGNRVLLNGANVSSRIRERDVTEAASRVSVHPRVRQWMVERQRQMGAGGGVIMEGRDIGTRVFPHADIKIFLEAAPEVRAQRRLRQQQQVGAFPTDPHTIAAEITERDARDRARSASPLVPAPDAVILDSTALSIDDVVAEVERLIALRLAAAP